MPEKLAVCLMQSCILEAGIAASEKKTLFTSGKDQPHSLSRAPRNTDVKASTAAAGPRERQLKLS